MEEGGGSPRQSEPLLRIGLNPRRVHPPRHNAGDAHSTLLYVSGPRPGRARHTHPVLLPPRVAGEDRCRRVGRCDI